VYLDVSGVTQHASLEKDSKYGDLAGGIFVDVRHQGCLEYIPSAPSTQANLRQVFTEANSNNAINRKGHFGNLATVADNRLPVQ
jgi:hypothetical protein